MVGAVVGARGGREGARDGLGWACTTSARTSQRSEGWELATHRTPAVNGAKTRPKKRRRRAKRKRGLGGAARNREPQRAGLGGGWSGVGPQCGFASLVHSGREAYLSCFCPWSPLHPALEQGNSLLLLWCRRLVFSFLDVQLMFF